MLRGSETDGKGTLSWKYSLTLIISGSNKDILENEAHIEYGVFLILKYLIFFSILITSLAYGSV